MISLRVEQLSRKFNRKTIFTDLSFSHAKGVLGIAGDNGSGKSTLMKCLAFLLKPSSGTIEWTKDGKPLDGPEFKPLTGYSAPYIQLYPELTVSENLRFLLKVNAIPVFESKLEDLFEQVQLIKLKHQLFGSLSTGQQQRAKLAAALVRDPQVLFLDEPGSNLDKKGHSLVKEIVENATGRKKMVILASNDPNEIALCDEVVRLAISN